MSLTRRIKRGRRQAALSTRAKITTEQGVLAVLKQRIRKQHTRRPRGHHIAGRRFTRALSEAMINWALAGRPEHVRPSRHLREGRGA